MDDRSLVATFLETRSEQVFRELYRRHTAGLYAMALRFSGGDEGVARELVQGAWIRAVDALQRFAWRSTLRTWLVGILANCHRERTRQSRRAPLPLDHDIPEARPDTTAARIDLEHAVRALPDGFREVFVLYHVHGYSHREIAQLLEVSEGTSKSQLSRARASLRAALTAEPSPSASAFPAEGNAP